MGGGIAQTFALAGHDVVLADADAELAERARLRAIETARAYERDGLVEPGAGDRVAAHLRSADSIADAVAEAEYVTEAVPEDPLIKRSVLATVSEHAPASAVVATNTSAIGLAELADTVRQPFIAAHWYNPAPFLPLVELAGDDEEALILAETLLRSAGKVPVRVPDVPGFLGNRLQFALYKEALAVVEEGLATPEQVDLVVSNSFGYRLPFFGPFAVGDIAGLDVYAGAFGSLSGHYGERFAPPALFRDRVESGDLGLKTGGGFRSVDPARRAELDAYRDRAYVALAALRRQLGPAPGLD
jgi:3-hydroxybutyryl-CoA dehydrogenase